MLKCEHGKKPICNWHVCKFVASTKNSTWLCAVCAVIDIQWTQLCVCYVDLVPGSVCLLLMLLLFLFSRIASAAASVLRTCMRVYCHLRARKWNFKWATFIYTSKLSPCIWRRIFTRTIITYCLWTLFIDTIMSDPRWLEWENLTGSMDMWLLSFIASAAISRHDTFCFSSPPILFSMSDCSDFVCLLIIGREAKYHSNAQ